MIPTPVPATARTSRSSSRSSSPGAWSRLPPTAHHLDIAHSPGSCGIVDAIDAYAEGLQFKSIKVYDQGRDRAGLAIVADNIRAPQLVVGDMEPGGRGADRCRTLCRPVRRYGLETVEAACAAVMDRPSAWWRAIAVPDGVYHAETRVDGLSVTIPACAICPSW